MENSDVLAARNGDIDSQKYLLENCQCAATFLTYRYLKRLHYAGLNKDDIHDMLMTAFINALNSYEPEKSEFLDYFKYKYLMQIRTEIRSNCSKKRNSIKSDSTDNIDSDYQLQFQSPLYKDESEKYTQFEKDEIYQLVVNERVVNLSNKEYELIKMYFDGYEIKAMSDYLQRNYTETCRSLKKAIGKIKDYFSRAN